MDNLLIKFYTECPKKYNFGTYNPNDRLNPYLPPEKKYKNIELPAPNYNNIIRPLSNTENNTPQKNLPIIRTIYNKPNTYKTIELSKSYTIPFKNNSNNNIFQRIGNIISSQELLRMKMLEDKIKELEYQNEIDNREYKKQLEKAIKENKRKEPTIIPNYRNVNFNDEVFLNGINDNYIISPIPIHGTSFDDVKENRRRQIKNQLRNARNKFYNDDTDSNITSRNVSRQNSNKINAFNNKDNNNKMLNFIENSFNNMKKEMQNKLKNLEKKQIEDYYYLRNLLLEQSKEMNKSEKSEETLKEEENEISEKLTEKKSDISSKIYYMDPLIELSNGSSYSKSSKNDLISFNDSDESKSKNRKHFIKYDKRENGNKIREIKENNINSKDIVLYNDEERSKNNMHILPTLNY